MFGSRGRTLSLLGNGLVFGTGLWLGLTLVVGLPRLCGKFDRVGPLSAVVAAMSAACVESSSWISVGANFDVVTRSFPRPPKRELPLGTVGGFSPSMESRMAVTLYCLFRNLMNWSKEMSGTFSPFSACFSSCLTISTAHRVRNGDNFLYNIVLYISGVLKVTVLPVSIAL